MSESTTKLVSPAALAAAAVPAGAGSDEPFTWTTRAGAPLTVPSIAKLDPEMGLTEAMGKAAEGDDGIAALVAQIAFIASGIAEADPNGEAIALIRKMRATEFKEFMQAWAAHSGTDLGESPAS